MKRGAAVKARPVLVIDDDPILCALVDLALSGAGFEVLTALDGLSGIEIARAARPAVILLDMIMPVVDGIATCKCLKRDRVLGEIPVVGMTDSPDLKYTEQAFHAGAEFFLPKPFGTKNLVHVVELAARATQHETAMPLRSHPRFPAELPVRRLIIGDAETSREVAGQTGNVSLGGLLLFLPETLPPGTVLRAQLRLPEGDIVAHGTVRWQGPMDNGKTRHGIQLLYFVEDAGLVLYRRYLSQIAAGSAA